MQILPTSAAFVVTPVERVPRPDAIAQGNLAIPHLPALPSPKAPFTPAPPIRPTVQDRIDFDTTLILMSRE